VQKLLLFLSVVLIYLSLFINALLKIHLKNNKTSKHNETVVNHGFREI
jgi:hypothetical protein